MGKFLSGIPDFPYIVPPEYVLKIVVFEAVSFLPRMTGVPTHCPLRFLNPSQANSLHITVPSGKVAPIRDSACANCTLVHPWAPLRSVLLTESTYRKMSPLKPALPRSAFLRMVLLKLTKSRLALLRSAPSRWVLLRPG